MAKKKTGKKAIKKPVTPKGRYTLHNGYIPTLSGRIITPGESFTADELAPERLAELKEKGLLDSTLTTEEKGTITK